MQLFNATPMSASYTLGLDPSGQEYVVVVVKGSFALSHRGQELALFDEQADFVHADVFEGPPGMSAMIYESEFAYKKPRCDVLLCGSAHAPAGRRVQKLSVALAVKGHIEKTIEVSGDRVWDRVLGSYVFTDSIPFERQPISYGRAYGGTDIHPTCAEKSQAFAENPVGVGYYPLSAKDSLVGRSLPITAEPGHPVTSWHAHYQPMAFGPLGRNFAARAGWAGTYDQAWLDEHFPFLPPNFDVRYFQSAPIDQQMDYPKGGEVVVLRNLTTHGESAFVLPRLPVPVEFTTRDGENIEVLANLDTIVIEPDLERVRLIWRASLPLENSIFDVPQAVIGRMSKGFYRARATGKQYYRSLAELAKDGRRAALELEPDAPNDDVEDDEVKKPAVHFAEVG